MAHKKNAPLRGPTSGKQWRKPSAPLTSNGAFQWRKTGLRHPITADAERPFLAGLVPAWEWLTAAARLLPPNGASAPANGGTDKRPLSCTHARLGSIPTWRTTSSMPRSSAGSRSKIAAMLANALMVLSERFMAAPGFLGCASYQRPIAADGALIVRIDIEDRGDAQMRSFIIGADRTLRANNPTLDELAARPRIFGLRVVPAHKAALLGEFHNAVGPRCL
jgi:hypothetical protein